jgi:hypothetical protein
LTTSTSSAIVCYEKKETEEEDDNDEKKINKKICAREKVFSLIHSTSFRTMRALKIMRKS